MTELHYRTLCDQLPGAAVISDSATGQILDCNDAAERLMGRSRDDMVGMHHAALLAGTNAANTHAEFLHLIEKGYAANYRTAILTKSGESVPVVINASHAKVHGKDAVIQAFTSTVEDAIPADHSTSAKDNQRTILAAAQDMIVIADQDVNVDERLRIIDNVTDVIWTTDMNLRFTYVSPSIWPRQGFTVEEAMQRKPEEFLTPASLEIARNAIDEELALERDGAGETLWSLTLELEQYCGDGSTTLTEVTMTFLRDDDGQAIGILGVTRDISERKQSKEALQQIESRYRLIAENVTDVIWTMDMNLQFTYVSPSIWRQQGFPVEEALHRRLEDSLTPASLQTAMKALKEALGLEKEGVGDPLRPWTLELEQYCEDRSTIWTEVTVTLLRDDDGQAIGVLGVTRDITERKQVEEGLRQAWGEFEAIYNGATDGILIVDPETRGFVHANTAICTMFGYSEAELLTKGVEDVHPPQEVPRVMEHFVAMMQGQETIAPNLPCLRKDGSTFFADITACSTHFRGRPALVGFFRDVTQRKEAAEALRASEERFRQLVDLLPQPVFEMDLEFNITLTNRSGLESFGYTKEDLARGVNISALVTQEGWSRAVASVSRQLAGEEITSREYTAVRKDGSTFPVLIYSSLITRDNKPIGLRGILVDITEYKRAEAALHESEERFRSLVEAAPDVIFTLSSVDGTITSLNSTFEKVLGWPRDEWLGKPYTGIVHPEDLPIAEKRYKRILQGESPAPFEVRLLSKSGQPVIGQITATPRVESGKVSGVLGFVRDITAQWLAEAEMRRSQERLTVLFEYAPDSYHLTDSKGIILDCNRAAEEILGLKREEMIGKTFPELNLLSPDDIPKSAESFRASIKGKRTGPDEVTIVRRDRRRVPVEVRTRPITIGDETLLLSIMHDITNRKRAEQALREREAKLKQIFDTVRDEIVLVDLSGKVLEVNKSVETIFGFSPEEVMGRSLTELNVFEADQLAELAKAFVGAATDDVVVQPPTGIRARHKDGHEIYVEANASLVRGAEGQTEGFLCTIRDLTERKRAEEEMARVKKESDAQVIQSAKLASLGEMATGIAHEINQPLNVIKMTTTGLLSFMKRGKEIKEEMLKSELEKTDRQVERMRVIIDHLRTFARRSSGTTLELVDMSIPAQDSFNMIGQQLRLRDIDVQLDLQELPKVLADSNKLEQVFLNIIGNARDAMDDFAQKAGEGYRKTLKMRSFVEDGKAIVTLSDTGGGIPANIRDRVFEPFFTTKDPGKGTGLGLSISYNIVKDFNGTLDFTVEEGVGTTFRVALPIAQAEDTPAKPQEQDGGLNPQ